MIPSTDAPPHTRRCSRSRSSFSFFLDFYSAWQQCTDRTNASASFPRVFADHAALTTVSSPVASSNRKVIGPLSGRTSLDFEPTRGFPVRFHELSYLQIQAFLRETATALTAMANSDRANGWRAFEFAHVIGQSRFSLHWRVHAPMLSAAADERNLKQAGAQLLRLALVPLGHLLDRLPEFNPGTGRVDAPASSEWPAEFDPAHTLERGWLSLLDFHLS